MNEFYQSIKGKNPTKAEFSTWKAEQWLEFLKFVDWHIEVMKKEGSAPKDCYNITVERIQQTKDWLSQVDHPWLEYIYRVDRTEVKPYLYRLQSMAMQAMKFLEIRPSLVTDDMRLIMQKNQSLMGKYLRISPGKPADVVPAEIIPVGNPLAVKQLETLTDTVDVVQAVVRRLKKEGVENMSVQSLISALPKLVDAVNKMQNRQIKTGNLTQINISSNAKDIEESMLALVKGDN